MHVGAVYVHTTTNNGVSWSRVQKLTASDAAANDWFGVSVSVSGNVLAIGARNDDDKGTDSGISCP